jgi:hypothetical protein
LHKIINQCDFYFVDLKGILLSLEVFGEQLLTH